MEKFTRLELPIGRVNKMFTADAHVSIKETNLVDPDLNQLFILE